MRRNNAKEQKFNRIAHIKLKGIFLLKVIALNWQTKKKAEEQMLKPASGEEDIMILSSVHPTMNQLGAELKCVERMNSS